MPFYILLFFIFTIFHYLWKESTAAVALLPVQTIRLFHPVVTFIYDAITFLSTLFQLINDHPCFNNCKQIVSLGTSSTIKTWYMHIGWKIIQNTRLMWLFEHKKYIFWENLAFVHFFTEVVRHWGNDAVAEYNNAKQGSWRRRQRCTRVQEDKIAKTGTALKLQQQGCWRRRYTSCTWTNEWSWNMNKCSQPMALTQSPSVSNNHFGFYLTIFFSSIDAKVEG